MATSKTAQLTHQDISVATSAMALTKPWTVWTTTARIGSFDGVLAQHLLYADKTNSYQVLVLEAGLHSLPKRFQNLPLQRLRCGKMQPAMGQRRGSKSILASNDFNQGPSHEAEPARHKD